MKCGGRTIKQMLKKYVSGCKVLGDDIYESHVYTRYRFKSVWFR